MNDFENAVVELQDENGKTLLFQHEMTFMYRGKEYIVLSPAEEMEDIAEDEVIFMELVDTDGEEGNYRGVDDELLLDALFAEYEALCQDEDLEAEEQEEEEE